MQFFFGFLLASTTSLLAFRIRSLSESGAIAAIITGTLIFGIGGWQWAILLLAFFISSSLLTRLFGKQKEKAAEKFSKGGQRDFGQVFANGGIAALFAVLHAIFPDTGWTWAAFAASLAAVNADTWATELGVLNPTAPRLITQPSKIVDAGTSGGISRYGIFASLSGAALIGILAALLRPEADALTIGIIITFSGLLGSLFDSYLGATVQAIYHCPACNKETERHPLHLCGTQTRHIRGWQWLTNDWVNFGCALIATTASLLAYFLLL